MFAYILIVHAFILEHLANYSVVTMHVEEENCEEEGMCPAYDNNVFMFNMVLYIGSTVSLLSVAFNSLIFYSLFRDPRCFTTHFIFLFFLSLFDVCASGLYVPVIVLDQAKDRFDIPRLAAFWRATFTYLMAAVNVALTSSCYLIVALQFERFLMSRRSKRINQSNRPMLAAMAVFGALVMKSPMAFEYTLLEDQNLCNETTYEVRPSNWENEIFDKIYSIGYKFWARNLLTIFIPFALLSIFNVKVVSKLQKTQRRADLFQLSGQAEQKNKTRAATRTFVLIASTYLASNALNVFVTAWEHISIETLMFDHCYFYMSSTDIVSLLTMCGCALRLPIYLATNEDLRRVILSAVQSLCPCIIQRPFSPSVSESGCKNLRPKPNCTPFDNVAVNIALKFSVSLPSIDKMNANGDACALLNMPTRRADKVTLSNSGLGVSSNNGHAHMIEFVNNGMESRLCSPNGMTKQCEAFIL